MHFSSSNDRRGRPLEVQLTPMIDVVFLLLIFFVCTANFRRGEEELPTPLAQHGQGAAAELAPEIADLEEVVVRLSRQQGTPRWQINEVACASLVEARRVLTAIAKVNRSLPVILDVADEIELAHVIDLYDLCRMLGLERIEFAIGTG